MPAWHLETVHEIEQETSYSECGVSADSAEVPSFIKYKFVGAAGDFFYKPERNIMSSETSESMTSMNGLSGSSLSGTGSSGMGTSGIGTSGMGSSALGTSGMGSGTGSSGTVQRVAQKAHETVDKLEQTLGSGTEKVMGWQQEYGDMAREQVRGNPLTVVASAFAVGFLFAKLMR